MRICDWSSDVCSSDLLAAGIAEDDLDAEIAQRLDQNVGTAFLSHCPRPFLPHRNSMRKWRLLTVIKILVNPIYRKLYFKLSEKVIYFCHARARPCGRGLVAELGKLALGAAFLRRLAVRDRGTEIGGASGRDSGGHDVKT